MAVAAPNFEKKTAKWSCYICVRCKHVVLSDWKELLYMRQMYFAFYFTGFLHKILQLRWLSLSKTLKKRRPVVVYTCVRCKHAVSSDLFTLGFFTSQLLNPRFFAAGLFNPRIFHLHICIVYTCTIKKYRLKKNWIIEAT